MAIRLGINGFGRIGRQVARIAALSGGFDLVGINDLVDPATNAHLFKYDSTYGRFDGTVELNDSTLSINGDSVRMLSERDPAQLPWGELGVDFVLECTGVFRTADACAKHIEGGAKSVLLSAPAKDAMPTYVYGVNHMDWQGDGMPAVVSNASCTTNCLAPIVKVLHENYGIKHGLLNTIHSYTNDQQLLDSGHKDLRRARSAAMNIIPTSTGAAKAIGLVMPELKGKLDGFAVRVPTPTGSLCDLTVQLEKSTDAEGINAAFVSAAAGDMDGVLRITTDPIVSSDIVADTFSCIVDAQLTKVMDGNFAKVVGWYDNEWGYSCRCLDLIEYMSSSSTSEAAG